MTDKSAETAENPKIGKYELIAELAKCFPMENSSTLLGIGDDAAVVDAANDHIVSASRLFQENMQFDLTYVPLKHLGYKVATIVFSDILGMNSVPTQLMLNLGVSNRFDLKAVNEILEGVQACCDVANADVVGLDLTTSRRDLVISTTAMGVCEPSLVVTRKHAKPNELICVSGDFAAAYAGLLLLEREKKVFEQNPETQPDFSGQDYLLRRQLRPEPRIDIVEALRRENILPTAMCCVSDGIAASILQICKQSETGCAIFEEKLPMTELTFNTLKGMDIVHTVAALNGGDDYELLFTIKQNDFEKIKNVENVSIIGYINEKEKGCELITNDNCHISLHAQGFRS